MNRLIGSTRPLKSAMLTALALVLAGAHVPAHAQDTLAEARIRRMEAEIRALQRQVFPNSDGKVFAPEIVRTPTPAPGGAVGVPSSTPVTDMLARMDAVESQIARLTAQVEQTGNRLAQIEARLPPVEAAAPVPSAMTPAPTPPASGTAATNANLTAMSGGAAAPRPAAPAATPRPATPSAARVAAVRAIEKPATSDAGDDEYSYGFRLWEAKFYPEAQQQLKLYVEKHPRHARISYGRNLLGRAYLDDGKPRDAATWFLQNFQADKNGARASDSLLYLAESMRQLKDTNRGCIALAEFRETYAAEAAGRLKSQYDATRAGLKCS